MKRILYYLIFFQTPRYFVNESTPGLVYDMLGPHMKFLLIVRDPVDRVHSDYRFQVCYTGTPHIVRETPHIVRDPVERLQSDYRFQVLDFCIFWE